MMKTKIVFWALALFLIPFGVAVGQNASADRQEPREEDASAPKLAAHKTKVKCAICRGKGSLKVSPPDVGQFVGKINDRSHWDVKINPCPVCERGRGWRTVWDLTQPEPNECAPCMTCGWSGLVQCRKCLASGISKCPRSDCKDGWIISKQQQGGRRSRRPPDVKLCPECRGVGKVSCPECKGMRANLCKRCFGMGRKR